MCEKTSRLSSLRNQNWKTVKLETEQINELLTHISTVNIYRIKRTNLCRSKISQWKKPVFPERTRIETQNLDGKFDLKRS